MMPPENNVGLGVKVTWSATLNARGVLSIVLTGAFMDEEGCAGSGKDCDGVDVFAPGHNHGSTTSVVGALDAAAIASTKDIIDLAKARAAIEPIVKKGYSMCVTSGPDDWMEGVMGVALTDQGIS